MNRAELESLVRARGVRFLPKPASRLMRFAAQLLRLLGNRRFLEDYWTTIGRTVFHPASVEDPYDHPRVIAHELVHVRQWERFGLFLWLSYLLLPLPFGLAWFRWRWEREAYLADLRQGRASGEQVDRVVESLWSGYGWPWPRRWMKRWFARRLSEAGRDVV
jgi:hypothetical protein